jgi:hypothetical protein
VERVRKFGPYGVRDTLSASELETWLAEGREEQRKCFDRLISAYIKRLEQKKNISQKSSS